MPKAYSLDLRERVARLVDGGHSRRAAAAHFGVSVSFVVNLRRPTARPAALRRAALAAGVTPSWTRIVRFCWPKWRKGMTSPCLSWLASCMRPPGSVPIPPRCRAG